MFANVKIYQNNRLENFQKKKYLYIPEYLYKGTKRSKQNICTRYKNKNKS